MKLRIGYEQEIVTARKRGLSSLAAGKDVRRMDFEMIEENRGAE